MSQPLPVPRPAETAGQRQPMPGWPLEPAIDQHAAVELYGERRVAYVQSADNPQQSVAIDARLLQPMAVYQPRDLSPVPLLDPMAQRLGCALCGGGVFAAGVGWGAAQVISAAAAGFTGLIALAVIVVAARLTAPRSTTRITQTVHNHNRLFGRSTTNL